MNHQPFVDPPLVSWITLVIAGAIRSVGHIIDYRKKKKAKKEAKREASLKAQAVKPKPTVSNVPSYPVTSSMRNASSSPSNKTDNSTALMPIAVIGAIAVVGLSLLRRK